MNKLPPGWKVASGAMVVAWAVSGLLAVEARADYGQIEIHEPAGLERERWPIQVGVPMAGEASAGSLELVRVLEDESLEAVPFQVLDEVEPTGFDSGDASDHVRLFEIAFLIDLPAHGSLELRLYDGEPGDAVASPRGGDGPALEVEHGDALARTVDTGAARFEFSETSGQMISYRVAGSDHVLDFGGRPIHGGGDVWAPRYGRWGNVRIWDIDDDAHRITHRESDGPIAWRMVRTGDMPNTDGRVEVSVSYTAFADAPFVLASSHMRFRESIRVNAVRKNQLVFARKVHTHGLFIDHDGKVTATRAYDPEDEDRRLGHVLGRFQPDVPAVGLLNADRGHGIGLVTLERANSRPQDLASAQDAGAHYYFFDVTHPRLDFFYVIRAEVFPADFDGTSHSWHATVVPAGSEYASRSAIVAFPVEGDDDDARSAELARWTELLRHPPRVVVR